MAALGKYILSVTAAALLLVILQPLFGKSSAASTLLRLIGGLFLAFTAMAPVIEIDFEALLRVPLDFAEEADAIAAQGKNLSQDQLQQIIKEQCEAYILDKALSHQTHMEVEVELCEEAIPSPVAVHLRGQVSPFVKSVLQDWLVHDLGIPKENQIWTG